MPLPTPNLDDRRFQDLVDEAKRMIPRYCPQWTDHNVSDPGVTLIELFAWMTETMLYRLNRVPEKSYINFMELMGVQLQPPTAARTTLTFWLAAPSSETVTVPTGTEVATVQTAAEAAVSFSTDADLVVRPTKLIGCFTSPDERNFEDQFWKLDVPNQSFLAFSPQPNPGDAFYLCYEQDHSNHILALWIDCTIEGIGVDPTNPPLSWEAWCTEGWSEAEFDRDEHGKRNDETGGLNKKGRVLLHLPPGMAPIDFGGKRGYWLRCRHTPPKPGQPTYSASPMIYTIDSGSMGGMMTATHARTIVGEILGRSDGMPGQTYRLEATPVLPRQPHETLEVQEEDGTWTVWEERADFAQSMPQNKHFVLDSVTGEVRFGPFMREPDGTGRQYGAIPPRGSLVRFSRYRSGGGSLGNVDTGKLSVLKNAVPYVDRVTNRQRAIGGRDAESLERAKLRAPQMLRTRDRAVTVEDYEYLAKQASSSVARARCLQPRAVGMANTPPPGVVQMLLVPDLSAAEGRILPEQLRMPQEAIQEVQQYLDERRLLTTIIKIGQPDYVWVSVDARLKTRPETDPEAVRRDAQTKLYRFLNPVVGGHDQSGWPFGRDLYISEVYAVLQSVPGVEYIEHVKLWLEGKKEPQDRITLTPNGLIASAEHRIAVV
ncbi:MAG TPA: putative baseplate assembly protein [Herpetosiphonaceae bacterium]